MFSNLRISLKEIGCSLVFVAGLASFVSPVIASGQAIPRITSQIDESDVITLKGNIHPLASTQFDLGPVEDAKSGRMLLVLKRSPEQEKSLQQLLQDQLTPGSEKFHKWLTPEQFGQQFGVADADIETVSGYLSAHGFTVGRVYKDKMAIEVSGTAGQLRDTFHTQIHSYSIHGATYYANANDPSIPAALAPVVRGFASLNNIRSSALSDHEVKSIPVSFDEKTHAMRPEYTGTLDGSTYLLTPNDIQTIYDIPATSSTLGNAGSGVLVGVVGDTQVNVNVVSRYSAGNGTPTITVIDDGNEPLIGSTTIDADTEIEYEQLELVGAAAPLASINYYVSATTDYDTGLDFAMIRAVTDDAVSVLTIGFQSCEGTLGASGNALVNELWLQAAAQGITVVAAAGDSGTAGCDTPGSTSSSQGLAVNGYASTPYDTAVGGTDFYYGTNGPTAYWNTTNNSSNGSAKGYIPEQAWNDSVQTNDYVTTSPKVDYAGGGGFSTLGSVESDGVTQTYYPIPSWQTSSLPVGTTARAIPDLAFFAGNNYNLAQYPICAASTDCVGAFNVTLTGGTAGAAAVFAGIMAEVVEKYGAQGNVNAALYNLHSTTPSIFHDTTVGNDSVACSAGTGCTGGYLKVAGAYAYTTATGYDEATGLGSVDASKLITDWAVPSTKSSTTALAITNYNTGAAVSSVVHGTLLNFKATVTGSGGTPTGDVAFTTGSILPSNNGIIAEPLSGGVAYSFYDAFLPGGSYNVTARYGGDSTFNPSVGTYPITVTPEPSRVLIYSSSPASGASVPFGTLVKITAEPFSLDNNDVSAPTGTLSVFDNGNSYPFLLMPLSTEGTATFSSTLLGGSSGHSIYFSYSGDASYGPSTNSSSPYAVTVTQASTTTTLSASGTTATSSVPVTLTATVLASTGSAAASTGVAPTGSVTFSTSTTAVPLVAGFNTSGQAIGVATIQVASSQVTTGGTAITATYSSDNNYAASTSAATTVKAATSTGTATTFTLTPNSATVATDGTLSFTGQATAASSPGACTVTYTITYTGTSVIQGTVKIKNTGTTAFNNFALTWTYANGQVMEYFYTGLFSQSGANVTVTGNPSYDNQNLAAGATFTSQFQSSWNNVTNTNPTAFALNGVPCNGSTNVPGTVQLYANGSILTGDTFTIGNSGTGTYTLPLVGGYLPFASGNVVITGVFTPASTSYIPSSATSTLTVKDDRTSGDFSISTDTLTKTISPSSSNVYFQVQLTALSNFAGLNSPIALSCAVPGSSNLQCTMSQSSATIQSSGIYLLNMEVSGYPTINNGAVKPLAPKEHWWLVGGGSALACVFLLGIPARRKGWRGIVAVMVCTIFVTASLSGCGSSALSSSSTSETNQLGSHPGANYAGGIATNDVAPGTYNIVITGTATTNTTLTHNTQVTVIVTTSPVLANGSYTMTNISSQALITDPGASTAPGTQLEQYAADGTNDQKWIFTYSTANPGYYTIQNAGNGLYITDPGSADSTSPVTVVTQQAATTDGTGGGVDATQLWTFNLLEGGYQIISAASGGVLDDDAFGSNNGTPVICYPPKSVTDGDNQTWYIQ